MPVRVRYEIRVAISSTSLEERDLCNVRREAVTDKQGEGGSWKTLLVGGATDVQIPLDSISEVRLLGIITTPKDPNQDPSNVLVRFNSISGEQRTIAPLEDCKEAIMFFTTDGVTSLYASNPGSIDMEMIIFAAGD